MLKLLLEILLSADTPPRGRQLNGFRRAGAFTLMEMMVAISILVVIMLAVGVIFRSASNSVGISEASTEMLSNVSAIQMQIERDVSGLSKDGFLVIRSSQFTDANGYKRRSDQISFISYGSFTNRTGPDNSGTFFTDNNTRVPAALIWWGQLALEKSGGVNTAPTNPQVFLSTASSTSTYMIPLNQVPTGVKDYDFDLGRHVMLLVPAVPFSPTNLNDMGSDGLAFAAYPTLNPSSTTPVAGCDQANTTNIAGSSNEGISYNITQSRVAAAQCTPGQLMGIIQQNVAASARSKGVTTRYEADHYCYRYGAVTSPFDGDPSLTGENLLINGFFRMHPIALQGVTSFAVEWTDGSSYTGTEIDPATGSAGISGTTRWYGPGNTKSGVNGNSAAIDPVGTIANNVYNDSYTAIFSFDNKTQWPTALRFRYHVADPSGRLPNGRDFVQIVRLPN